MRPQREPPVLDVRAMVGCGHRIGVVFDVDGTLVDSERDGHRVAFNQAFEEAGLDCRWDPDTYGRLLSITGGRRRLECFLRDDGWDALTARVVAGQLHERKTEIFTELAADGRIRPRPGVARLLCRLLDAGIELHVATTGSARWVHPLLRTCFGDDTFGVVVCGEDVRELKPAPDAYLRVLAETGLDPGHVVAVEDSPAGLSAARSAGLACVIVRSPYPDRTAAESWFAGATWTRSGFGELRAGDLLRAVPVRHRPAACPPSLCALSE